MIFPSPKPLSAPKGAPKRPNRVNRKRKKSAFERCYHSLERVEFVKATHCLVDTCEATDESVNAHVVKDEQSGMSRKAGYRCIAPLCPAHHYELDEVLGREKFQEKYGCDLQYEADKMQRTCERWGVVDSNEDEV